MFLNIYFLLGLSILFSAWKPYLPRSILWRQKEQFSDGVGYSWIDGLVFYYLRMKFN